MTENGRENRYLENILTCGSQIAMFCRCRKNSSSFLQSKKCYIVRYHDISWYSHCSYACLHIHIYSLQTLNIFSKANLETNSGCWQFIFNIWGLKRTWDSFTFHAPVIWVQRCPPLLCRVCFASFLFVSGKTCATTKSWVWRAQCSNHFDDLWMQCRR